MTIKVNFSITLDKIILDVNIELPTQGITALFGPSGCGKTTLLRAIAGLDKYKGASCYFNQVVWQDQQSYIPVHQRNIAYVFQESSLFEHLTVQGNLNYGVKRTSDEKRKTSLQKIINLLDIKDLLHRKPSFLSGGERQRVAIARALSTSPQLILMDEPIASLDDQRKQELLPFIHSLSDELNIPILYVSHSPDEVARLADHLVLLEKGKVLGDGPINEMLTRFDLSLAHRSDAEAIIEATIAEHDTQYALSLVNFSGGQFTVPATSLSLGNQVRLRIAAQDVSLTLEHQQNTSILNIFPAEIIDIIENRTALITVKLRIGEALILAKVTQKSKEILSLEKGKKVYAQIKSVAVLA